jgi:hypothetical protein
VGKAETGEPTDAEAPKEKVAVTTYARDVRRPIARGIILNGKANEFGGMLEVRAFGDSPQAAADLIINLAAGLLEGVSPRIAELARTAAPADPARTRASAALRFTRTS